MSASLCPLHSLSPNQTGKRWQGSAIYVGLYQNESRAGSDPANVNAFWYWELEDGTRLESSLFCPSLSKHLSWTQGRSQDLVSGGGTHFGGGRPPIFRLRPQITRVPPYVLLATLGFRAPPAPLATPLPGPRVPMTRDGLYIPWAPTEPNAAGGGEFWGAVMGSTLNGLINLGNDQSMSGNRVLCQFTGPKNYSDYDYGCPLSLLLPH